MTVYYPALKAHMRTLEPRDIEGERYVYCYEWRPPKKGEPYQRNLGDLVFIAQHDGNDLPCHILRAWGEQ